MSRKALRIVCLAMGLAAAASVADAAPIYFFVGGGCEPCGPVQTYGARLVLDDAGYSPGGQISRADFVSYQLNINSEDLGDIPRSAVAGFWGATPGSVSEFLLQGSFGSSPSDTGGGGRIFLQAANGRLEGTANWYGATYCAQTDCSPLTFVSGTTVSNFNVNAGEIGSPAPVPLPPAIFLAATGFAALFAVRRRRA